MIYLVTVSSWVASILYEAMFRLYEFAMINSWYEVSVLLFKWSLNTTLEKFIF